MRSVREKFVAMFGEEQASAVERAANYHDNGVNSSRSGEDEGSNRGTDPFKWALLICIGYECMEKPRYREYHGIAAQWDDIKSWIKREAELDTHDGGCDYLSLFCGTYDEYMPEKSDA